MSSATISARTEWRNYWYLPFVAALGYSAMGLHVYTLGPFMEHLERDFGWTRVQISVGLAIVSAGAVLGSPLTGALVDRIGPRPVGLLGVLAVSGSVALLGTATGTMANWVALWIIYAIFYPAVNPMVWSSAVASRFEAGRGVALAVTMTGVAVTAGTAPLLATALIASFGWRTAFAVIGALWALATFPLLFLFFRGARDVGHAARAHARTAADKLPGMGLGEALREPIFYKLLAACTLITICIIGTVVHFVPLLLDAGTTPATAAGIASLIGLCSVAGRLGTGALLDRFPGHIVGAGITLLFVPGIMLLLWNGIGSTGYFVAACMIGLTLGSEADLIAYLTARKFGLRKFGLILGVMQGAISLGAMIGPIAAGAVFDRYGGYEPFLLAAIGLALAASLLIGMMRRKPEWDDRPCEPLQPAMPLTAHREAS